MVAAVTFLNSVWTPSVHKQRAGAMFSTALEAKQPWVFWVAHGSVCLFGNSEQSARAGQTLAKKAIKVKKSAVDQACHPVRSFVPWR
jgi:hypothetical protein